MKIRKARTRDIDELSKLFSAYLKEEEGFVNVGVWDRKKDKKSVVKFIKTFLKKRNKTILVADNGKLVGFLFVTFEKMPEIFEIKLFAVLNKLYVLPNFRGKKISSKLKNEFFMLCKKKEVGAIYLHVAVNNKVSKIYKKWGLEDEYMMMVKKLK